MFAGAQGEGKNRIIFLAGATLVSAAINVPSVATESATVGSVPTLVQPGRPHGSYDPHAKLPADTMLQIALRHQAEGRPHEALATLHQAIARYPDNANLYSVRGSILLQQQQVADALRDLEKAVSLNPDSAEALTNRAQAYRRFGRIDAALTDLDRAVALKPDLIPARFNRGALRFGEGNQQGALDDFDHCIAVDPHLPAPYFNRAAVYNAMGRREEAIEDIKRFKQIAQDDSWRQQADEILKAWHKKTTQDENQE